eukprot:scaffold10_cov257-Pinguiococcus_pyrenoidosus.AAC.70
MLGLDGSCRRESAGPRPRLLVAVGSVWLRCRSRQFDVEAATFSAELPPGRPLAPLLEPSYPPEDRPGGLWCLWTPPNYPAARGRRSRAPGQEAGRSRGATPLRGAVARSKTWSPRSSSCAAAASPC